MPRNHRDWLAAVVLAGLAFACFAPCLRCGFINYDDPDYVTNNTNNPGVRTGLSREAASRAFTTFAAGNWHPLTWLSLQLDATLWKTSDGQLNPLGFHLTSVLLHSASAALLFLALRDLTESFWRSAVVAILFAVHPLRVESVAWIAERKDVLSVFFGMLALWAYAGYARRPAAWRYLLVALAFVLSLLSKPMLVTLPCVFLVLDWWPLGRARVARDWLRLGTEKLPLFALAAASALVTFNAQSGGRAVIRLDEFPIAGRVANAVFSYAVYLGQTVWPFHLAAYYPYVPGTLSAADVAGAGVVLAAITAGALVLRRRAPYLLTGWLWYAGTLVPVIGLVQVGLQSHADRYSYFPQIGLLLAGCWGVADLYRQRPRLALAAAAALASGLVAVTWHQLPFWSDPVTLWRHNLEVTGPNPLTCYNLGSALEERNDLAGAARYYRQAYDLQRWPKYEQALLSLGNVEQKRGQLNAAIDCFQELCKIDPDSALWHCYLGKALGQKGDLRQAAWHHRETIRLAPRAAEGYCNLGHVEARSKHLPDAIALFEKALALDPNYALAHCELGVARLEQHRGEDAIAEFKESIRCDPRAAPPHFFLGTILESRKQLDAAALEFLQATELDSASEVFRQKMASCLNELERAGNTQLAGHIRERLARHAARQIGQPGPGAAAALPLIRIRRGE